MDTKQFWSMIEDARKQSAGRIERQHDLLIDALVRLPETDIQEFNRILWTMMARAYRADLWDAAYFVACYCGDDGFEEFQSWLITQGQAIFEKVLEDPEYLADIADKEQRFEIFDSRMAAIAEDAYLQKTGLRIPESGYTEKVVLTGGPRTPEDKLPEKYPRIMSKFGVCEGDEM